MNLNENIDLLLADYFQLTAKKTDRWLSLQRSDIFQDANGNYTVVFLSQKGPQIMLVDRFCNEEVYSADQIIPLFNQKQDPAVLETIRTFYQNCPSNTVMSEQMIKALQAMSELSYPTSALASAYLVRQGEHWGVVEPKGNILIEPKYAQVKLLGIEETFRYFSDLHEQEFGGTTSDAVMYVCTENFSTKNSVDVYNLAGELVYHGIQTIRPHEQKLITPTDPLMDRFTFPRYRDTLSFCIAVEDHNNERDTWHLYQTDELFLPVSDGLRKGALVKSGHWEFVNFADVEPGKKEYTFLEAFCNVVANQHGKTAGDVMSFLSVYNHWRQINTPIPVADLDRPLDIVFPDITVRSHRLLRFRKVNTARELGELSLDQVMRIRSLLARNEILCLKERIDLSIKKEK